MVQRNEGHDRAGSSRQADTTIPREIQLASTLIKDYGSRLQTGSIPVAGDIRRDIYNNKLSEEEYENAIKYVNNNFPGKIDNKGRKKKYNIKVSLRNTYSNKKQ
jgi:DNA-directed RNA polymerase